MPETPYPFPQFYKTLSAGQFPIIIIIQRELNLLDFINDGLVEAFNTWR